MGVGGCLGGGVNICMLASVRSFIIPCLWLFFSNLAPACCKYLNLVMRFAVASSRDRKTIFLLQADYFDKFSQFWELSKFTPSR